MTRQEAEALLSGTLSDDIDIAMKHDATQEHLIFLDDERAFLYVTYSKKEVPDHSPAV